MKAKSRIWKKKHLYLCSHIEIKCPNILLKWLFCLCLFHCVLAVLFACLSNHPPTPTPTPTDPVFSIKKKRKKKRTNPPTELTCIHNKPEWNWYKVFNKLEHFQSIQTQLYTYQSYKMLDCAWNASFQNLTTEKNCWIRFDTADSEW